MIVKFHFFPLMVVDYVKLVNLWWVERLEEVSIGCPFPRIRNCIRLSFGQRGTYERLKTKHFDPRRRCRHSYWQRMVNNVPTSWIQELLVSSMETNNEEELGIYAIDGIDPTRIILHQDKVSIHCEQLIDKRSGNPISHHCLQC